MKKMNKIDRVFIITIAIIGIMAGINDIFYWKDSESGGFPVYSCISIFISYALWIILLIYSSIKNNEKNSKPKKLVRWYMYFLLPFYHIAFVVVGILIASFLINIFNL